MKPGAGGAWLLLYGWGYVTPSVWTPTKKKKNRNRLQRKKKLNRLRLRLNFISRSRMDSDFVCPVSHSLGGNPFLLVEQRRARAAHWTTMATWNIMVCRPFHARMPWPPYKIDILRAPQMQSHMEPMKENIQALEDFASVLLPEIAKDATAEQVFLLPSVCLLCSFLFFSH